MKTLFLVVFLSFSLFAFKADKLDFADKTEYYRTLDCGSRESISIQNVLSLDPQGYQQWEEGFGFADGQYFHARIVFSDGVSGTLFQGGNSKRYFVENSGGSNFYYVSLESAVRALYLYKKYGCLSSKYRY